MLTMHCILCIVAMYNFRLISAQVLDQRMFNILPRHSFQTQTFYLALIQDRLLVLKTDLALRIFEI